MKAVVSEDVNKDVSEDVSEAASKDTSKGNNSNGQCKCTAISLNKQAVVNEEGK